MSDEQEDYTRSFVTRSDIDKEAAWEVNKKKIEKPGYVYIRHTSDEYVSGIRNASDGVAWGASQLNLKDLKGAVGTGADYDDTDIQRELAAQAKRIETNEDNIVDLDAKKADEGHTHDDAVSSDHTHDDYQPKGDYATKTELSTGLSGKADDPHTHDYAADDHDHDTVYQPKGDYATGDHGHDEYETKTDANIVHDTLAESIAGKADDDHDHAGVYAPFDHGHDGLSTDDHTHDEYQPKGNYADSTHLHPEYAETGDITTLTNAIEQEAKDRASADSILQDQIDALEEYDDSALAAKVDQNTSDIAENKASIEALGEKGYDDTWIQPALDGKSDTTHTHDDLATGDHTHDEYLTSSDLPDPYDDTQVKLDIQANADAIALINESGYDDTQIRLDFAAADADTLSSANDYTDEKIGAIPDPVPYDDTQVKADIAENAAGIQANKESIEALGEKGYDDTGVKADIAANTAAIAENTAAIEEIVVPDVSDFVTSEELSTGLSGKADEPHTHDEYLTDLTHDHNGVYQPAGDYATNDALTSGLAGKSDTTHTHDAPDLTHDHSGVYSEEGHTHDEYLTDLTHDHTGEYQPVGDYALDTHTHDTTHDHEGVYQPLGDYATKTELSDGLAGKSDDPHTHDEYLTDLPDHDHPHNHDGDYQPVGDYQPAGDYATKGELTSGLAGKEDVGHTHDTTHDHDDYAKVEDLEIIKGEIIDIETELEAIAPNREKGDWEAADGQAPRPGQANLTNPSFTAQQNVLTINQIDANDETHTFSEVEEGDNIEIAVDENNLGLYEVAPSPTRSDIVTLNLTLLKGQGSIKSGDQIKINIFGLADQNLDLEELDERYFKLTGGDLSSGGAFIGTNRLKPQGSGTSTLYEGSSYSHPQSIINSGMMKEYAAAKEHEHDIPSAVHVGLEPPENPSEGDLWFLTIEDEDNTPDKLFIWANDTWEPTTSLQHERRARIAEDLLVAEQLSRADSHYMHRLDQIVLPEPMLADKAVVVHDGELPEQITDDKIHFKKDLSTGDYLGESAELAFRGDEPDGGIKYAIIHHKKSDNTTYREEWNIKQVTYENGTVTVKATEAFGDSWASYDNWACDLWLLTEEDVSNMPYLPITGGTLTGDIGAPNLILNGSGDKWIKENETNRIKFNGRVTINRGDSTDADGFEIKGKTANGSNDKLFGVYHNASGLDAINYWGKQEGNENLATVKYVKDSVNNKNYDDRYLQSGEWPEEDWNGEPLTGFEIYDFADKMFKINDLDQKLQDESIKRNTEALATKADLDGENTFTELQTMKVTDTNAFWTMKLNGGTVCTIWTNGEYTGKYVADPKQTAMITRKWYEEQEAVLLQKINALQKRVDVLDELAKPAFDSVVLKLERGKTSNFRPTGTNCASGVAEVWHFEPQGNTTPKNEMKLNIGKSIDNNEWNNKLREVHVIQGSKRQIWKVEGSWVTNTSNNILHFSSNNVTGDTLDVDAQTEIRFLEGFNV